MDNNRKWKYIRTFIYVITVIAIIFFFVSEWEKFLKIGHLKIDEIIILLALNAIPIILLAYLFKENLKIFSIDLPFIEWFGLSVSNTMYNYFTPLRGGMAIRAYYLKKKYDFSYTNYISYLSGYFVINFLIAASISFFSALFLYNKSVVSYSLIIYLLIIVSVLAAIIGLSMFSNIFQNRKSKISILNRIYKALEGVKKYGKNKEIIITIICIQIAFLIAMAAKLYFVFLFLDMKVSWIVILFIQSLLVFSMIISVTPGNLGIKEGIIGLFSSLLGITTQDALFGAIIDRAFTILIIMSLGLLFSKLLLDKIDVNAIESK